MIIRGIKSGNLWARVHKSLLPNDPAAHVFRVGRTIYRVSRIEEKGAYLRLHLQRVHKLRKRAKR